MIKIWIICAKRILKTICNAWHTDYNDKNCITQQCELLFAMHAK